MSVSDVVTQVDVANDTLVDWIENDNPTPEAEVFSIKPKLIVRASAQKRMYGNIMPSTSEGKHKNG